MTEFNAYRLTKWRRLLLVRDCASIVLPGGGTMRRAFCVMCRTDYPTYRLQAHHVRPKSLYPNLAYSLANGVSLCLGCHMQIVHAGNSFVDIESVANWRFFVPAFDRHVRLAVNQRFNEANQERI